MTPTQRDGTTRLDPDRRRPAPEHPGWADFPRGTTVAVCHGCSAVVPATDADIANHEEHHLNVASAILKAAIEGRP